MTGLFLSWIALVQPAVSHAQNVLPPAARPKLIVQITVDQLRGDEPFLYRRRFGPGGFNYLLNQGAWYRAANHPHSHTETLVGHATLSTGAFPSRHGMIGNNWYDREAQKTIDGVESTEYPLVGTQTKGAWPGRILTTTFGDELAVATANHAKVFGVSVKDRAAVAMAGHAGKAFWFNTSNGQFVTSTYYYKAYPEWVTKWNDLKPADRFKDQSWKPMLDPATYLYAGVGPFANNLFGYGKTFPHPYGSPSNPRDLFYTKLTISPAGDDLTVDFALELIKQEKLGKHDVTDYLAVSFSANDLVGHIFTTSSLEMEDILLRLDRSLARLFTAIDASVGLRNTIIVLAGDHGIPAYPKYLEQLGVNTGDVTEGEIEKYAKEALLARYGSIDLVQAYVHPFLYLDRNRIAAGKLDEAEVERTAAQGIMALRGIYLGVPCTDLRRGGEEADSDLIRQIRRSQSPGRSGDVYVVQKPQWQVDEKPPTYETATIVAHGSPWAYDTFVPIVFAGAGVTPRMIFRPVQTVDVAVTLSLLAGTTTPSGSAGSPLTEVLEKK